MFRFGCAASLNPTKCSTQELQRYILLLFIIIIIPYYNYSLSLPPPSLSLPPSLPPSLSLPISMETKPIQNNNNNNNNNNKHNNNNKNNRAITTVGGRIIICGNGAVEALEKYQTKEIMREQKKVFEVVERASKREREGAVNEWEELFGKD